MHRHKDISVIYYLSETSNIAGWINFFKRDNIMISKNCYILKLTLQNKDVRQKLNIIEVYYTKQARKSRLYSLRKQLTVKNKEIFPYVDLTNSELFHVPTPADPTLKIGDSGLYSFCSISLSSEAIPIPKMHNYVLSGITGSGAKANYVVMARKSSGFNITLTSAKANALQTKFNFTWTNVPNRRARATVATPTVATAATSDIELASLSPKPAATSDIELASLAVDPTVDASHEDSLAGTTVNDLAEIRTVSEYYIGVVINKFNSKTGQVTNALMLFESKWKYYLKIYDSKYINECAKNNKLVSSDEVIFSTLIFNTKGDVLLPYISSLPGANSNVIDTMQLTLVISLDDVCKLISLMEDINALHLRPTVAGNCTNEAIDKYNAHMWNLILATKSIDSLTNKPEKPMEVEACNGTERMLLIIHAVVQRSVTVSVRSMASDQDRDDVLNAERDCVKIIETIELPMRVLLILNSLFTDLPNHYDVGYFMFRSDKERTTDIFFTATLADVSNLLQRDVYDNNLDKDTRQILRIFNRIIGMDYGKLPYTLMGELMGDIPNTVIAVDANGVHALSGNKQLHLITGGSGKREYRIVDVAWFSTAEIGQKSWTVMGDIYVDANEVANLIRIARSTSNTDDGNCLVDYNVAFANAILTGSSVPPEMISPTDSDLAAPFFTTLNACGGKYYPNLRKDAVVINPKVAKCSGSIEPFVSREVWPVVENVVPILLGGLTDWSGATIVVAINIEDNLYYTNGGIVVANDSMDVSSGVNMPVGVLHTSWGGLVEDTSIDAKSALGELRYKYINEEIYLDKLNITIRGVNNSDGIGILYNHIIDMYNGDLDVGYLPKYIDVIAKVGDKCWVVDMQSKVADIYPGVVIECITTLKSDPTIHVLTVHGLAICNTQLLPGILLSTGIVKPTKECIRDGDIRGSYRHDRGSRGYDRDDRDRLPLQHSEPQQRRYITNWGLDITSAHISYATAVWVDDAGMSILGSDADLPGVGHIGVAHDIIINVLSELKVD